MLFNPKELLILMVIQGFIQYMYARICSVLRRAPRATIQISDRIPLVVCNEKEREVIKQI